MSPTFNWNTGPLAQGLHCYRAQQFFEAHEHWESVWLTLSEPEKSFLQAVIQITAAFHHLHSHNVPGAVSLMRKALRRLDRCPSPYCCLDLNLLRQQVSDWLSALQNEQQIPTAFPEIRITKT